MAQDPRFRGSMNGGLTPPGNLRPPGVPGGQGGPVNLNLTSTPTAQSAPAGFWIRFVATIVDIIILYIIQAPLSFVVVPMLVVMMVAMPGLKDMAPILANLALLPLTWGVIPFFWFGWFYKNKGATPGKLLLGLRVMHSETGQHLSYWRSWCREIPGKMVSGVPLCGGYIMAGLRSDKKALHDLLCSTQVIRTK